MDARTITSQQMKAIARLLLFAGGCPLLVENKSVFWEYEVDSKRRRVIVRGNYMLMLELSRSQLLDRAKLRGISL